MAVAGGRTRLVQLSVYSRRLRLSSLPRRCFSTCVCVLYVRRARYLTRVYIIVRGQEFSFDYSPGFNYRHRFSSFFPFIIFMVSCDIYVVSATASGREDVAATVLWSAGGHCSRMYGYAGPPHYGAVESTAGDPSYLQPGPIPMAMVMPMPAVCEPPQPAPTALQMSDEATQKRRRYRNTY